MNSHQIAHFTTPRLACARVCPPPFEDHIVSIGIQEPTGWKADVWKLTLGDDEASEPTVNFGVDKVLSSVSDTVLETQLASAIGGKVNTGLLRGAELALAIPPQGILSSGYAQVDRPELILCGLSENGYVTTSVSKVCYTNYLSGLAG
jgi:hypothetical protein